jgi:porphobilinogen synthase
MLSNVTLTKRDLISPMFVTDDPALAGPIESMPGVRRLAVSEVAAEGECLAELGIPATILFGVPAAAKKNARGTESFSGDGAVQQAVRKLREAVPDLVVITDVCMCEYTSHGHCGLLHPESGEILNDETLEVLGEIASSLAASGADIVAPSGMMDGAVGAIRAALDAAGSKDTAILAYAVKYASAFYGPFREAAGGAPAFGDRRTHQMDPASTRAVLREVALDIAEGADMVMVKPALAYLDVIAEVRRCHPDIPLVAYNVSGEYAMVRAAAAAGWLDERAVVTEMLTAMKRAGADSIITYHARDFAGWGTE